MRTAYLIAAFGLLILPASAAITQDSTSTGLWTSFAPKLSVRMPSEPPRSSTILVVTQVGTSGAAITRIKRRLWTCLDGPMKTAPRSAGFPTTTSPSQVPTPRSSPG